MDQLRTLARYRQKRDTELSDGRTIAVSELGIAFEPVNPDRLSVSGISRTYLMKPLVMLDWWPRAESKCRHLDFQAAAASSMDVHQRPWAFVPKHLAPAEGPWRSAASAPVRRPGHTSAIGRGTTGVRVGRLDCCDVAASS